MAMPKTRLSKEPEEMFNIEANPAPRNDPKVDPKLTLSTSPSERFQELRPKHGHYITRS
jgi:hypothetical protein